MPDWPMEAQVREDLAGGPPRDGDAVNRILAWLAEGPPAVWCRSRLGVSMFDHAGRLVTREDVADAWHDFLCGPARTAVAKFDPHKGRKFTSYLWQKLTWFGEDRAKMIRTREQWFDRRDQTAEGVKVEVIDTADQRPDQIATLRAFVSAWEAALNKLSPEYREVYLRHIVQGWPLDKIAMDLDIPVGTVGTRLYRARRHMRSYLQPGGWADA